MPRGQQSLHEDCALRTRPINLWRDALALLGAGLRCAPLVGPRVVQLNIADRCNLRCTMCNQWCFPAGDFLEAERAIALVEELAGLGLQELFWHGYGEPCLHPRLAEMVATVGRRHPALRQFTVTNGTCISESLVGSLREWDVRVRISAHAGSRETWARIHPHNDPGLFDRMRETTARLAEGRPERTELLFALFETNRDQIDDMVRLARQTGVRRMLFRPLRLFPGEDGAWMNAHLMPGREDFLRVRQRLLALREELRGDIEVCLDAFAMSGFDSSLGRPVTSEYFLHHPCLIGWVFSVVETDGRVHGCLPESSAGPLGNIHRQSFREIWWSDAYRAFRRQRVGCGRGGANPGDCHTFCQHLDTNRRLNDLLRLRIGPRRQRDSATVDGE
jgi:MoaA/NifB/PqqE/SkfB family radical SAM enzyme